MILAETEPYAAYIGIDWADRKHDFCLQVAQSDTQEFGVLEHTPEAIERWATALHKRFGGPIAVCLETTKGPLVNALLRYEFFVLFPVHAATLAGYRKAFSPSGAKDDPPDDRIALDLLLRHPERLQALKPQSSSMRMLATLVEGRRQVGNACWTGSSIAIPSSSATSSRADQQSRMPGVRGPLHCRHSSMPIVVVERGWSQHELKVFDHRHP